MGELSKYVTPDGLVRYDEPVHGKPPWYPLLCMIKLGRAWAFDREHECDPAGQLSFEASWSRNTGLLSPPHCLRPRCGGSQISMLGTRPHARNIACLCPSEVELSHGSTL